MPILGRNTERNLAVKIGYTHKVLEAQSKKTLNGKYYAKYKQNLGEMTV